MKSQRWIRAVFIFLLFPILVIVFNNCSGAKTAESINSKAATPTFVPINTKTGWSDSPFISRDGQRLYFMYSRYNFAPAIKSGFANPPVLGGPDRPGLHKATANPYDESDYYVSTRNPDGSWGEPMPLGFNSDHGDSSGMEIDNGNTFIWLRGDGVHNDIVMSKKDGSGNWSTPQSVSALINDHSPGVMKDNPYLSPDGTKMWFTSNRAGSLSGSKDIWFSQLVSGVWGAPTQLGSSINTSDDEDQIWFSPTGTLAIWNGPTGLLQGVPNGSGGFNNVTNLVIPGCFFTAEVSMPDDGQSIYFGCVDQNIEFIQIMYSIKQPDGSWGPATPVD